MEAVADLAPSAGLWCLPRSRLLARRYCLLSPVLRGSAGAAIAAWHTWGVRRRAALCKACSSAAQRARDAELAELAAGFSKLASGIEATLEEISVGEVGEVAPDPLAELLRPGSLATSAGGSAAACADLALTCAALAPHLRLRRWLGSCAAPVGAESGSGGLAEEAEALLDLCAKAAAGESLERLLVAMEGPYVQALELELAALEAAASSELLAAEKDGDGGAALLRAARIVPPRVLIVAGSDSGGGAGIQADLKSCTALGAFGMTAIAALTAQNSQGVQGIFPVPVDFVQQQMRSVLDDIGADVIKTGMLATSEIVSSVAQGLRDNTGPVEQWRRRLVLDPVMVSTSGHVLLQEDAVASVKKELFPKATIITPNLPEAQLLLAGRKIETVEAMEQAARDLCAMGPAWALVKGGHLKADEAKVATDVLCNGSTGHCERLTSPLVETSHTHGTGCTLASSIAALLARGLAVPEAVRSAKRYVSGAIEASAHLALGSGPQGPMNHSWEFARW